MKFTSENLPILLPGPDRKRTAILYNYRLAYRDPNPATVGCVLLWEVSGGRLTYQVALERDEAGSLHLHCTCADAVYRAENEGRFCKHVRALLELSADCATESQRAPLSIGA